MERERLLDRLLAHEHDDGMMSNAVQHFPPGASHEDVEICGKDIEELAFAFIIALLRSEHDGDRPAGEGDDSV